MTWSHQHPGRLASRTPPIPCRCLGGILNRMLCHLVVRPGMSPRGSAARRDRRLDWHGRVGASAFMRRAVGRDGVQSQGQSADGTYAPTACPWWRGTGMADTRGRWFRRSSPPRTRGCCPTRRCMAQLARFKRAVRPRPRHAVPSSRSDPRASRGRPRRGRPGRPGSSWLRRSAHGSR